MTEELPGLDLARFREWYDAQRPDEIAGDLSADVIAGGRSNLTYTVTDGHSAWIVRRPPLGHVQATAHDMGREYTVMSALADTDVPVPTMLARCTDPDVLGAPFYVMEQVVGTPYRRAAELDDLGRERTAALSGQLVDVLAALHDVDPASVGLGEFGRPHGYLTRQVKRWGQQLEGSQTQDRPAAFELHRRLTETVSDIETDDPTVLGIVHGDYRLDNVLVGASAHGDDQILAVVDWEMATLGDTRADLALLQVYDDLGRTSASAVSDVARAKGYPTAAEQIQRYAGARGLDGGELSAQMPWHLAMGCFKLAVILEGIHYRYLQGQTVGEGFDNIGEGFDNIVEAGLMRLDDHVPAGTSDRKD